MIQIILHFYLHQPFRLKNYPFFNIGSDHYYYDDFANEEILRQVVDRSYRPALELIEQLIETHPDFRVALTLSGSVLTQMELHTPDMIQLLKRLVKSGRIEILGEPISHGLCGLYDEEEYANQLRMYRTRISSLLGVSPVTLSNPELIYSDRIAQVAHSQGYKAIVTEGAKHLLAWKSPNYLYNATTEGVALLMRHAELSDAIAHDFARYDSPLYPYTTERFFATLEAEQGDYALVSLPLETLGSVWSRETGIFEFLRALPEQGYKRGFTFTTPQEIATHCTPQDTIQATYPVSRMGEERDTSLWTGNELQQCVIQKLEEWGERIRLSRDQRLLEDWINLQGSDHLFYMTTKLGGPGAFSPYETPYAAFTNYMNVLSDFLLRVSAEYPTSMGNEELSALLQTIENQNKKIAQLEAQLAK